MTAALAHAGESGSTIKADELKAEPFRDAKTVGQLGTGDKVEILNKDGGWLQVKSAKGNGWVRMLSVRKGEARKSSDPTGLAGMSSGRSGTGKVVSTTGIRGVNLDGLASGRVGTGKVVATTGIRGLNEEELKAAKFDEAEIKRAESYLTSRADAQKFAAKGKLIVRSMDYLPDTGETR